MRNTETGHGIVNR